jgi:predicted DNA-binding protein (UPF0251 family)
MPTCSRELLLMVTSTLLASWFAAINRPCAVFCASWCGPTWNWPTISPRKRSFGLTKTSGVSEAKRNSRKRKELVGIDEERLQAEADPQTTDPGLRHDLMNALANLPLHERTAVTLCCQNGLSHDEAARVLDIPLGTVKTNVLRGREKLKKMLAAWAT